MVVRTGCLWLLGQNVYGCWDRILWLLEHVLWLLEQGVCVCKNRVFVVVRTRCLWLLGQDFCGC